VINNGYGWQLTPTQKKLSDVMSERETGTEPEGCGNHSRPYIAGVLCVTRISGRHMRKYFIRRDTALFRSRVGKPVILRGSIINGSDSFHAAIAPIFIICRYASADFFKLKSIPDILQNRFSIYSLKLRIFKKAAEHP